MILSPNDRDSAFRPHSVHAFVRDELAAVQQQPIPIFTKIEGVLLFLQCIH